jgi:hypothetical protein
MTLNERILDFLDGSLPADDEAELLHTLSVSPEQRTMLRGFIEQRTLLARDAKSLSVPYAAEQRLWARMDQVLPLTATQDAGTVIVPMPSNSMGFFARAMIGAVVLLAGIGIGYFAGHSQTNSVSVPMVAIQSSQTNSNFSGNASSHESDKTHESYGSYGINRAASRIASTRSSELQNQSAPLVPPSVLNSDAETVPITPVTAENTPTIAPSDIGGDGVVGIKPLLHYVRKPREDNGSLFSRFEFRFDESLGRQYPNNPSTIVSQPTLTNLSFTTFFQVFPHSDLFWAGLSGGTASVAQKGVFSQAISPSQAVLENDTASYQTKYGAVLAELRLPAFDMMDMTFTGGYGLATLGQMMFGEIGLHCDLSNEAGIQCGLRLLRFTYSLSAEKQAAIASSGASSLTIPSGVATPNPSLNAELNVGLFFHF